MALTIHELPAEERPREKMAAHGASALTDAELIAILLRVGTVGVSAIDLARQLVQEYGSLGALSRCSLKELARKKGVGLAKAVQLSAAFGLASRLARERLDRAKLDSPELIYALLGAEMRQLNKESLRVCLLDTKLCLVRTEQISLGSINECVAHPREIFEPVIRFSAHGFVLVHNHPSGDPLPSDADRRVTVRLREAASLLQIKFLDHVIIGTPDGGRQPYFSFKEAGMLE